LAEKLLGNGPLRSEGKLLKGRLAADGLRTSRA
jgi:hypothetical protein